MTDYLVWIWLAGSVLSLFFVIAGVRTWKVVTLHDVLMMIITVGLSWVAVIYFAKDVVIYRR